MIGTYVQCDGCGFRLFNVDSYPATWVALQDAEGDQHFCARSCALLTVGNGGPPQYPAGLTQLDVKALELIASGKSNKEIARALDRCDSTVKNRLVSVFVKLGVEDRYQALLAAHALGILNVSKLAEQFYSDKPGTLWSRTAAAPSRYEAAA